MASAGSAPMLTRSASAIGRSKWLPSLARSAGARLMVMRLGGRPRPIAPSALRTRSRDSATALSGRLTMVNAGGIEQRSRRRGSYPRQLVLSGPATLACLDNLAHGLFDIGHSVVLALRELLEEFKHPLGLVALAASVRDQILLARGKIDAAQHARHIGGGRSDGRHHSSPPGTSGRLSPDHVLS